MTETGRAGEKPRSGDYPYFRRLWNTTVLTLLAAAFIPFFFIGAVIYTYTTVLLKQQTLVMLENAVQQQKTAIDQFFDARIQALQLISGNLSAERLSQPDVLTGVLQSLSTRAPYFVDLSIIDHHGRHLAYTGPFDLMSRNYQNSDWYMRIMTRKVFVSDLFLGFRNIPHAVIAVKSAPDQGGWILRGTLNAAYVDAIAGRIAQVQKGDAFLINKNGIYQTTPKKEGGIMTSSGIHDPVRHQGVAIEELNGRLRLSAWLDTVDWISVVEIDKKDAFAAIYRLRSLVIYIFVLSAIMMFLAVLLTTNYLITRLESKRRRLQHLDEQLRHASRVATAAGLYKGAFARVKDGLSNIDVAAGLIGEALNKTPAVVDGAPEFQNSVQQIQEQTQATRRIIDACMRFDAYAHPVIADIRIDVLLNDLIELNDWEIRHKQVNVIRKLPPDDVVIRSDPAAVRHVLQCLLQNALEAVDAAGEITLAPAVEEDGIRIIVADSGPGIAPADQERIFEALFTTQSGHAGLGLAVARSIVEKLGGELTVDGRPGKGAAFTLYLPNRLPYDQT